MNIKANDSAFPMDFQAGLTKREYFAAAALQGLLATGENIGGVAIFAKSAVQYADALIMQLNKEHNHA